MDGCQSSHEPAVNAAPNSSHHSPDSDKPTVSTFPTISDPFSVGVKLGFLIEQFHKKIRGATTTDISNKLIMPMTASYQCSLAEYWTVANPSVIGIPVAFISHAWKYPFEDLISALLNYFGEDQYVWLDFVCNNQHKAPSYPFEWWS
jgi:hypothetical protein